MAAFVAEHFLHPEVVRAKLQSVNLAKNTAMPGSIRHHGHDRVLDLGISLFTLDAGCFARGARAPFYQAV